MIESGFLNINKPKGKTSAQIVAKVKRELNLPKNTKIGHMGTLDPMASGVLVVAIGSATKAFDILLNKRKTYRATFTFGFETDTLDSEGETVNNSQVIPYKDEIERVLPSFIGLISQVPPSYSAKNIKGKRAYTLARQGKDIELEPSMVQIYKFDLVFQNSRDTFTFDIECGSGTYIRSLCRDLAYRLGSVATMTALTRIKSGIFDINTSITPETVTESDIMPLEKVFADLEKLTLPKDEFDDFLSGKKITVNNRNGLYRLYNDERFWGIVEVLKNGSIKRRIKND